MLFQISKYLLLACFLFSCATPPKPVKPLTRRERQLLYYQKLRQAKWDEISKKSGYHHDRKVTIETKRKKKNTPAPKRNKPTPIPIDPDDQRIEIEQLIGFHCIKARVKNCDEVSTQVYTDCLQEFNPGDKRLTYCIKKKLRH